MCKKIRVYALSIALAVGVGLLSAFLTRGSMDVYAGIRVPPLAPPAAVFPIVWTVLFVLMGVSSGAVYLKKAEDPEKVQEAVVVYLLSLLFNFSWSNFFFNFRAYMTSFAVLVVLWILIYGTIKRYRPLVKWAAYLQIPYLVWVTFAGYLNLAIWILN